MFYSLRFATLFAALPIINSGLAIGGPLLHYEASQEILGDGLSASTVSSVTLDGQIYINRGLVGFGIIPHDFRESTGDTLGGIGSAIAIKHGTWKQLPEGKYKGTLFVHPDRGYNVDKTIDYQARRHELDFTLAPYYKYAPLSYEDAKQTFDVRYVKTLLELERDGNRTTGLDALAYRARQREFDDPEGSPFADPELPIPAKDLPLTLDVEGLVVNPDGTYWISDEYGPYIYKFTENGRHLQTIQPPDAILPRDESGKLNFTSAIDPHTGRPGNNGFESLTLDPEANVLYAMLQSATIQDGGDKAETARYTRLLAYDVVDVNARPELVGEWVVPLPLDKKGKALECNEIHFVSPGVFLVLSRDGAGRGNKKGHSKSQYKQVDLFSIKAATDIHGTKYDSREHSIAKKGKLVKRVKPAEYVPFVDFIDSSQLTRFGLHNGKPDDHTLIDAKWESLALAPVGPQAPNDYFLFTVADNDFQTRNGFSRGFGGEYDAGINEDTQFLVFRVTLPTVPKQAMCRHLGIQKEHC